MDELVENEKCDRPEKSARNYGLDLLKIISMIMIIFLHINSHGGLNNYWAVNTLNGSVLVFLRSMSIVSVNAFVLISGYFLINGEFKISKLVKLVLEVFFYSIVLFIALRIRSNSFSLQNYLKIFLPITYNSYWFVTAYIGMYVLSPFLNKLIRALSDRQLLLLVLLLILLYSALRDIFPRSEPFSVSEGYSLVWFIVLYLVGATIRRLSLINRIKHPLILYLALSFLLFFVWCVLSLLSDKISAIDDYNLANYYFRYNSLPVLMGAILLFIGFARLRISQTALSRLISFVSPLTFGVYLIHDNEFFRSFLWNSIFNTNSIADDCWLIPKALGIVLLIFVVCCAIDLIRFCIEKLLFMIKPIDEAFSKADRVFNILLNNEKRTSR